ncbi:MAG TPA: sigma-70 family RNA polymerase sigma factor [Herpetosiphonaceae bacterium]
MTFQSRIKTWLGAPAAAGAAAEADFEALYRTELPRIYNFFRFRVGDGPLAEDLTSATFEKAWRHRQRYQRDLSAFSTWLFTIARRVAVDHYRSRRPDVSLEDRAALAPAGGALPSPEAWVERQDEFDRLSALLAGLSERDREVVSLRYGAGLTNRRIAEISGLSESNVGVILHRTLLKLRSAWED